MGLTTIAMMVLAGCGGGEGDLGDDDQAVAAEAEVEDEPAAPETEVEDEADDEGEADGGTDDETGNEADAGQAQDDAAAVMALAGRQVDGTVMLNGFEISVTDVSATDLDLEASPDGKVDRRSQGVELTFDLDVHNPTAGPGSPRDQVTMRWEELDSGNVFDVRASLEVRDVPSVSTGSGTLTVVVPPEALASFDQASSRLVLGPDGSATSILPVGDGPELVDRLTRDLDLEETLMVGDVEVSITDAYLLYYDEQGRHLPLGTALLELTYDLDNTGEDQSCSTRGTGAWSLTLPDDSSIVDLGVSERCVRAGQSEVGVLTGFEIDEDYAGDYTLVHERSAMGQDHSDEITFTVEEVEGVPARDRD